MDFSELGDFIDIPLKKYSSGMGARLAFSVSINIDPEILILDEVLSVGDELFRRKCFSKMEEFFNSGKTILFVTHDLSSVLDICSRAIILHEGEIMYDDVPEEVIPRYRNLLSSLEKNNHVRELQSNEATPNPFYIKQFESKSANLIKHADIDILNISLTDSNNIDINSIPEGTNCKIKYKVQFSQEATNVSFGAEIYNTHGKNITGAYYPDKLFLINKINIGEEKNISLSFNANLIPGLYMVRLVVRGDINGLWEPLVYFKDVLPFKIIDKKSDLDHVTEAILFIDGSIQ